MRKALFLCALFIGLTVFNLQAQQPPARNGQGHYRIEAMRVSFITSEMQLTPEEAAAFWPIYNEYRDKARAIRQSGVELDKPVMDLSEDEAKAFVEQRLNMDEDLLKLKRAYYLRLQKVVSARKLILLERAERKFKEKLLREMRMRQQKQQKQHGPQRHKR